MPRPGWTTKPCPVCGSTKGRTKDRICFDCQKVYDAGKRQLEFQEQVQDKIVVKHTPVSHWESSPYVFMHGSQIDGVLQGAWHALVDELAKEPAAYKWKPDNDPSYMVTDKPDVWGTKNDFYSNEATNYRLVDRKIHEVLNHYDLIVRMALEFCYYQGLREGADILLNLNNGETSSADYEERKVKIQQRIDKLKKIVETLQNKKEGAN